MPRKVARFIALGRGASGGQITRIQGRFRLAISISWRPSSASSFSCGSPDQSSSLMHHGNFLSQGLKFRPSAADRGTNPSIETKGGHFVSLTDFILDGPERHALLGAVCQRRCPAFNKQFFFQQHSLLWRGCCFLRFARRSFGPCGGAGPSSSSAFVGRHIRRPVGYFAIEGGSAG